ncbi:MAG: YiiD C-terminal domain-containing protein [Mycobacterium sp.]|nr:YiiD C-terminal domain-containing protein [Mycobacterium sp.]MDR3662021.1 YiiD C-terminal domain-containing protein [Mycobacterium sp.]
MTSTDNEAQQLEFVNSAIAATVPAAHAMGVRAVEVRRGFAATTAPISGNGNHFGVMYAGVLFTVAEVLGGLLAVGAFDASQFYPLVKDMSIQYKAPAKSDVRAEAALSDDDIARVTAEAAERGKSEYLVEAVVTDADGTVVATTRATCQLRRLGK